MKLLLKVIENNADIVELGGGFQMPPVKALMDDTSLHSSKESFTRKILNLMDKEIYWCRKKFIPKKYRSQSLWKGKGNQNIKFRVGGERNQYMSEESVKSYVRWLDESLKYINQVKEISRTLQESLHKIDRFSLQRKFKV